MAFVSSSASRVGTPKPRNACPNPWRVAFKALTGGLWVMAGSLIAVTAVLLGTGWLLAVSTSARSAVQPLAALSIPPGGLDFTAVPKNAPKNAMAGETSAGVSASAAVAERFVFGTQWPLRLTQTPRALLDLLPPELAGIKLADAADVLRWGAPPPRHTPHAGQDIHTVAD